jgi:predicted enzyme related to lactoylglutathione lyase
MRMKRFHVHVAVEELDQSIRFYSTLFATEPTTLKPDYAKWMLEDPRVNFAISQRGTEPGIEHLAIQAENEFELNEVGARLNKAGRPVIEEKATTRCYARSDKKWIADTQGIWWKTFLTHGEATLYGGGLAATPDTGTEAACCASSCRPPQAEQEATSGCGCAIPQAAE